MINKCRGLYLHSKLPSNQTNGGYIIIPRCRPNGISGDLIPPPAPSITRTSTSVSATDLSTGEECGRQNTCPAMGSPGEVPNFLDDMSSAVVSREAVSVAIS